MIDAAPLRFIVAILGGWVCVRAFFLAPEWAVGEHVGDEASPAPGPLARLISTAAAKPAIAKSSHARSAAIPSPDPRPPISAREIAPSFSTGTIAIASVAAVGSNNASPIRTPKARGPQTLESLGEATQTTMSASRVSLTGWAIARDGGGAGLATGGTLGGNQAGLRATYPLGKTLAIAARLSSSGEGAEAALGIEWQPSPRLPIKLLAERRQAIGGEGRSDFALIAHGGVSAVKIASPVVADAYVQAGVVGVDEPDLFADGTVKVSIPVGGGVEAGAGAWGAAQPGVARLDVGPQVSIDLPGGAVRMKVSAEWRSRIAGDAAPGSGPALTVATSL